MRKQWARRLLAGAGMGLMATSTFGITTTGGFTADQLVSEILGPGITVVPGSVSYTGAAIASGKFSDRGVIGINSGILLTSGSIANVDSVNNNDAATTVNNLAGDAQANSLIPGFTTRDATVLEFKFVSSGGDLFFNYAFGSEEYNEWVSSSFNDVFGFFLDGVNIALLPGTSTPVAINTVNNVSNSGSYVNNDPSDLPGGSLKPIEYDGFTTVLTAQALGLAAGEHTIRLVIADAGDWSLDSGVFIQSGTFSDTPLPPGGGTSVPDTGSTLGLLGLAFAGLASLRRK
jgi:hypothetical protein